MCAEELRDYYDVIASGYDELYGEEQEYKYKHVYLELGIKPGKRILDVGCGTGLLLEFLKKQGLDDYELYVCLEPSLGMIEKARSKVSDPRVLFVRSSCEEVVFYPGYFDHITLFTVWDNLRNHVECVRNLSNTMRTHGVLVLTRITRSKRTLDPRIMLDGYGFRLLAKSKMIDEILVYEKVGNKILK